MEQGRGRPDPPGVRFEPVAPEEPEPSVHVRFEPSARLEFEPSAGLGPNEGSTTLFSPSTEPEPLVGGSTRPTFSLAPPQQPPTRGAPAGRVPPAGPSPREGSGRVRFALQSLGLTVLVALVVGAVIYSLHGAGSTGSAARVEAATTQRPVTTTVASDWVHFVDPSNSFEADLPVPPEVTVDGDRIVVTDVAPDGSRLSLTMQQLQGGLPSEGLEAAVDDVVAEVGAVRSRTEPYPVGTARATDLELAGENGVVAARLLSDGTRWWSLVGPPGDAYGRMVASFRIR